MIRLQKLRVELTMLDGKERAHRRGEECAADDPPPYQKLRAESTTFEVKERASPLRVGASMRR